MVLQPADFLPDDGHRQRLIDGMASAIVERGYAESTIADIVRHAHVSKRTFYEYFPDKQACLLACYEATNGRILRLIEASANASTGLPWRQRLALGMHSFINAREAQPTVMSALMIEVLAAGREGLRVRREVHQRFAKMFSDLIENERLTHPEMRPLSSATLMALIGGIHELLLKAYEDGVQHLGELAEPTMDFISSVVDDSEPSTSN